MKKASISLLAALALLAAGAAQAQDKPVLNTAPPGTTVPTAPVPAPTPAPAQPVPQTTPDRPSGMDLPSRRDVREAGGGRNGALAQKLFIYSNFGLGYYSNSYIGQFNFSLAPALGYRITEKFAAGPGISYAYKNYSAGKGYVFANGQTSIASSNIGVKVFAQYIVYNEFFIHGEYEVTRAEILDLDVNNQLVRLTKTVSTPLLGLGYRNQFSDRVAGDILLLYNFDNNIFSIYPNPVYRFSLLFNLGR